MHVITDCAGYRPKNGLCLTIGNFDGLHLGHRALIDTTGALARKGGLEFAIMTFWPHPRAVLPSSPGHMPLSTRREKLDLLLASGADTIIELPFTLALASLSAADFVDACLAPMNLRHLVVGHDFTLGKNRTGTIGVLRLLGEKHNFKVDQIAGVNLDGEPVSSSRLRRCLQNGDAPGAASLLGRFYSVEGTVKHGEGRGRIMGFPTANLADISTLLPANGVYATLAWHDGQKYPAVTSIGTNPTFNGAQRTVETFIPDRNMNLYGSSLRLDFVARLRDIRKFEDANVLAAQIASDTERAREILNAHA